MNLFKRLFSRAKDVITGTEELQVRGHSQEHVLQSYMRRRNIQHGELVEANLKNVRVERTNKEGQPGIMGDLTVFFCPLEQIEVTQRISKGDFEPIPERVTLHNFTVDSGMKPGLYNINNVMIMANGTINVMTTKNTTLEMV